MTYTLQRISMPQTRYVNRKPAITSWKIKRRDVDPVM